VRLDRVQSRDGAPDTQRNAFDQVDDVVKEDARRLWDNLHVPQGRWSPRQLLDTFISYVPARDVHPYQDLPRQVGHPLVALSTDFRSRPGRARQGPVKSDGR